MDIKPCSKTTFPALWKSDLVINNHVNYRHNTITVSTLQHFLSTDHMAGPISYGLQWSILLAAKLFCAHS